MQKSKIGEITKRKDFTDPILDLTKFNFDG
jgi:hypothetical protein